MPQYEQRFEHFGRQNCANYILQFLTTNLNCTHMTDAAYNSVMTAVEIYIEAGEIQYLSSKST